MKRWIGINPVIFAKKSHFYETLGGINPVILAQKSHFYETLGWYQPSDLSPEKTIF